MVTFKKTNCYYIGMKNKGTNVDWNQAKIEYVTTDISYDKLAKKLGVSKRSVYGHGSKEGWVETRKEYCRTVAESVIQNSADEEVDRLQSLKSASCNLAEYIDRKIREMVDNDDGSVSEIKEYVNSLRNLVPTVRDLFNIETLNEIETRRIALERLELEKKRYDIDCASPEVKITFENGAEDYGG